MTGELRGKRVTVAGLGRFGGAISVSRWLVQQGAQVLVTDKADADALADSRRQLEDLPIEFRLGEHREEDFANTDLVVASPAVPPASEYLRVARAAGIPVTTEIRLFIERCPGRVIGISGTKGKSTTATMLGLMLQKQQRTFVGGNIGRSLLFELPDMTRDDLVVLELSSFMLEYLEEMRWSPHVALVTMIAPDHLDRHKSFEKYIEAKQNLLRFQGPEDWAVLNEACPICRQFAAAAKGKVLLFGLENRKPFQLKVPGQHNQVIAQAAFAAASLFGIDWDDAQQAVADFAGLPHRLQLVHESCGVRWYDDSIATIPEAAIAALDAFPPRSVIQVIGGYDKGLPIGTLCSALVERSKAALCIGTTGPKVAQIMAEAAQVGAAPAYECGDLATAVAMARRISAEGDVVVLSPGFASYDQFANFEQRGEAFAKLARESE